MQVQRQHAEQTGTQNPQHRLFGRQRVQQPFQKLGIPIEFCCAEIHLGVANHVEEHKTHECNAGDGHCILFAYRCAIQIKQQWPPRAGRRCSSRYGLARGCGGAHTSGLNPLQTLVLKYPHTEPDHCICGVKPVSSSRFTVNHRDSPSGPAILYTHASP
jgi:hypothetical protein